MKVFVPRLSLLISLNTINTRQLAFFLRPPAQGTLRLCVTPLGDAVPAKKMSTGGRGRMLSDLHAEGALACGRPEGGGIQREGGWVRGLGLGPGMC